MNSIFSRHVITIRSYHRLSEKLVMQPIGHQTSHPLDQTWISVDQRANDEIFALKIVIFRMTKIMIFFYSVCLFSRLPSHIHSVLRDRVTGNFRKHERTFRKLPSRGSGNGSRRLGNVQHVSEAQIQGFLLSVRVQESFDFLLGLGFCLCSGPGLWFCFCPASGLGFCLSVQGQGQGFMLDQVQGFRLYLGLGFLFSFFLNFHYFTGFLSLFG